MNDINLDAKNITFCKRCITPDSRPRIYFNNEGICNACLNSVEKKSIDWNARKKEFETYVEKYRSQTGGYDCIVPWSGGKDSSSIAYRLKFEFGLNPLLVTFSPMIPNEIGNFNRESLICEGFDHYYFRPNQKVMKKLAKRFFIERGNPKVCWDAGVNSVPIKLALRFKIPLVFYAEHGESEYGGHVQNEEAKKVRDFTEVIEHQIGDNPLNWESDEVTRKDLESYIYPDWSELKEFPVKALYYGYFFKWSMYENYNYIKGKYPFKLHPAGRTPGTFTDFDSLDDKMDNLYYYMQFIKFGFGRTVRDASRLIQNGHMNRKEALDLALKYDGEYPYENFSEVLEYLDLTKDEFVHIVDSHRNPEIWKKEDSTWSLRFPVK